MTIESWWTLIILAGAILMFITEWVRVDIVALSVVVSLMLSGVLTTHEALSGFSNPAVLTIAALFVVGGGVLQTGLADLIGRRALVIAGDKPFAITMVLMVAVAALSSFLSDTGTVAVLLPATLVLARSAGLPPSKLLIPLSFGSLMGGAMTLIGTTPNLIVTELLAENNLPTFSFFSFTPIGMILFAVGLTFMLLVGRNLLPDRIPMMEGQPVENPDEIISRYRLPDNLFHLRIRAASPLVNASLADSHLRQDYNIHVLEILRRKNPRQRLSLRQLLSASYSPAQERISVIPTPETILQADDILVAQTNMTDITKAAAVLSLGVRPTSEEEDDSLISQEIGIAEVLLPPRSTLSGKTISALQFGSRYHLNVLGINRPSSRQSLQPKDTPLRFGDILLVQGPWKNILNLRAQRRDFVVLGQPESMFTAPRADKVVPTLLVLIGMLALMVTNLLSVTTASLLAALMIVFTGCLSIDEAYQTINWKSLTLIAGMLPMSIALEKTGLVDLAAQAFSQQLGAFGPWAVLAGLFLLTSIFTQVLSNTATAVLVAPVALAAANSLDIQPQAFMMAVAIAASMAFASPVASPVNTLVMGAGDYRFSDYLKIGLPMIFLTLITSILVLPLLFPF